MFAPNKVRKTSNLEQDTMGTIRASHTNAHTWQCPRVRTMPQRSNYIHGMSKAIRMVMLVIAEAALLCV